MVYNLSTPSTSTTNYTTYWPSTANDTSDDDYYISNIASMTVDVIGVICNILLIIAIIIDPLKILRQGAWITILNLSLADLISCGSNFLELYFVQIKDFETTALIGEETIFFWNFGVSASFMLLTLLTIQIYMIIKYPVKSRLILTRKKVAKACLSIWVLAVPLGLCNLAYVWIEDINVVYFYIASIAVLEITVAIQVVLKIRIAMELLRRRKNTEEIEIQNQKQKINFAKTVILLNIVLILTAFPYFLAKQIEYLALLGHLGKNSLLEKFSYYYEPIALLCFVTNPILYSLRLQNYRRTLFALLKLNCSKRRSKDSSTRPFIQPSAKRTTEL